MQENRPILEYEKRLVREDQDEVREPVPVRSAAFRRLVTEAYDFRCAASGWRVILPDCTVLVEAAHLIPFSESHNDRPQNGIALTPTFHWALDQHIIAPGPDNRWHVSSAIDPRIADNTPLFDLDGKDLLLPNDKKMYPDKIALEWCMDRLRSDMDTLNPE